MTPGREAGPPLVARGVLFSYASLGVGLVSMLVLTPIVLRAVGATAYGVWVIWGSIFGYFALLDFGTNTATVRYTAEYRATGRATELGRLLSTVLAFVLMVDLGILVVCLALLPVVPGLFGLPPDLVPNGQVAFLIMGVNVALALVAGVFASAVYGFERVDLFKTCALAQTIVSFALSVLFMRAGLGLVGLALAALASTAVAAALAVAFLRRQAPGLVVSVRLADRELLGRIVPYSARTFVLAVTSRVLYYTDYLVIGAFLGPAHVARYEIAYKLCFLSTHLFSVVSTTLFPRFSGAFAAGDRGRLGEAYLRMAKISLLIVTPLSLFLAVSGPGVIELWVGAENFVGVDVLLVLVAMNVFHAIGTPAAMALQSTGRNRELVYSEVLNAILNLVLSILLVRRWGVVGAAVGTLASHLCTSFWVVIFLPCRHLRLPVTRYLRSSLLRPLGVGAVTAALTALFVVWGGGGQTVSGIASTGAVIGAVYLVLYLALGSSPQERALLASLWRARLRA